MRLLSFYSFVFQPSGALTAKQLSDDCQAKVNHQLWTLISDHSDTYKFWFYCPATHVTSQVLQPASVNKRYRGRHPFISLFSSEHGK